MTFTDEKIYPDASGLVFGTNAENIDQLKEIQNAILALKSVNSVSLQEDKFPYKLTVVVSEVTQVEDIQKQVIKAGYHVIPYHSLDF